MASVSGTDMLVPKLASPPYAALIEWVPAASEEVENVATPDALSVPVPRVVEPSLNVTIPVGVPMLPAAFDTVAVNVTCCPVVAALGAAVTAVIVSATVTISVTIAVEVLPRKLVSPEYFAVIEWIPTDSDEVMNAACPFTFSVPVPICMLPSKNCTVPVGVPVVELETVAVNVTDCPKVAGLAEDMSAVELAACWMV